MFAVDLYFTPQTPQSIDAEVCVNAIETYLIFLRKGGQIAGKYVLATTQTHFRATVYLPDPQALALAFHCDFARRSRDELQALGLALKVEYINEVSPQQAFGLNKLPALYLYTFLHDIHAPVCAGDSGRPIPLYHLPIETQTREDILRWAKAYQCHDILQIDCGALEIAAYTQMADVHSELSQNGLALCRTLEARTGLPTYYYLYRYWAFDIGENDLPCPGCGKPWFVGMSGEKSRGLAAHAFQCQACRLISNPGDAANEADYASIGVWKS